jgi:hypothetical protein
MHWKVTVGNVSNTIPFAIDFTMLMIKCVGYTVLTLQIISEIPQPVRIICTITIVKQ